MSSTRRKAVATAALAASIPLVIAVRVRAQTPELPPLPSPPSSGSVASPIPIDSSTPPPPPPDVETPVIDARRKVATTHPDFLPLPVRPAPRRHVFVIPGYLFSMSPAVASNSTIVNGKTQLTDVAQGHGAEVSVAVYEPRSLAFWGAFAQAQAYGSFKGDHSRYALGVQGGWFMTSGELGLAYRTADNERVSTLMLQLGTVMSLAFFNIGGRFSFPLHKGSGERSAYPVEASLTLAVKIPILVD